ncbi:PcfJ domain-containing protein [Marinobacter halophilus]|uniref:PcfJ-like protein n=1 Tax=Marinobacter halophilus TaxID=1323740 RepID=A0A2T1K820_9GAMM|nr:PcfJ domain-containing protein [Marinobacter halophilus]PSF06235.1 hypothetical protein C7H08_13975 [Marinobacter halophilus]GGC70874.1 hypothetical protein GCM10011362_19130 [Marinobacter halophilus]
MADQYDLGQILHYPIRVEVYSWDSRHPLHWVSYNDEGRIAEGLFLEPPALPLFTLEDDAGRRLCDALPESVSAVAALMPASKSLVRLVRRLALSSLLPWELEDIHTALQNQEYLALMRHHPYLHLNHIRLLNRIRGPLWPGLLNLVDEHTSAVEMSWLCRMIRDTLAMAGRNEQVLAGIHSREALQAQHDRLVERFNRANSRNSEEKRQDLAKELSEEHGDYPKPPLVPIDGLEPLCSWLELLEEGATMRHCVGSYDVPVALGEVFIYRMIHPERLTISLECHNKTWVLGEVRGVCNSSPSEGALDWIRRWVNTDRRS